MAAASENKEIIRYLLDEMKEQERLQMEERLIRDPAFFEIIAATEDDLIMQYLREDLGHGLLSRFTEVYMESPARRARVESARTLRDAARVVKASREPAHPKVGWLWLLMAGAAVVTVLALFLIWSFPKRPQLGEQEQSATVSFSLKPGLTRSSEGTQILIPKEAKHVQFQLQMKSPPGGEAYRAVLGRPEQETVWTGTASLTAQTAVITVPAEALRPGDYTLELQSRRNSMWEEVETYYFRVLR